MKKTLIAVAAVAASCFAFAAQSPPQVHAGPAFGFQGAQSALIATAVPVGVSQRADVKQVAVNALAHLKSANKANVGAGNTANTTAVTAAAHLGTTNESNPAAKVAKVTGQTTGAFAQRVGGIAAFS